MNNVLINKKKKENNSHTFCKSYNTFYHAIFFLYSTWPTQQSMYDLSPWIINLVYDILKKAKKIEIKSEV